MTVNIASPEFKANPFPYFSHLRANEPVHPVILADKRTAWLVTRYDDVVSVLKDERLIKNRFNAMTPRQIAKMPWIPKPFMPLMRNMLDLDAPDHTRLRTLVHKAFTPRLVESMRERVQTLANDLLDVALRRRQIDLIRDFALPLPTTIIAQMLGVAPGDQNKFHRWSSALLTIEESQWGMLRGLPHVIAFLRFIRKLVKSRRMNPQDDLTTALVQAEESGDQLSEDELLAMIFLLLIAGHETTVNLIGNGTLALLQHPNQMQNLRNDPALIKSAVEELLRFESPLYTATERFAREDLTIAGSTVPRGGLILAVVASANRDQRQFLNPDTLDLSRADNKHLSFGLGVHYCLGAPLARIEGQIAIATLLRRTRDLRLGIPPNGVRWRRGLVLRGLEALPTDVSV
ncbi:MAG: cytochrome P450 family protein [Candidatus Acidiferrales bacterium]